MKNFEFCFGFAQESNKEMQSSFFEKILIFLEI